MNLIKSFLVISFLIVSNTETFSQGFSLYVRSEYQVQKRFVDLLNRNIPASHKIESIPQGSSQKEFGIYLVETGENASANTIHQEMFLCSLNRLFNGSSKSYTVSLVDNSSDFLIADAKAAILDIADIEKINVPDNSPYNFSPENVLVHELIEQQYIQGFENLKSKNARSRILKEAHKRASQKESLQFSFFMEKTHSVIRRDVIYVEFSNRADKSKVAYNIYHDFGNVTRVERVL